MNLRFYLVVFFLITGYFSNAQNEAAIWYFGENAGLDFNSGAPVALTDGALVTREGCATISDTTGSLLFYTDGITVWNRNHVPMPNGTGLLGDPSSTQSAIIVPYPGKIDLYYVFTVHDAGEPEGFQYSMVDMTLNGGLGDVTTKNILLSTPVAEKLTAVEHSNGSDIWVVVHEHGSDHFLAYLVTPTGLFTTPVISAIGENLPILTGGKGTAGYMKISPDGQFLVYVTAEGRDRHLFRFDTFTGQVSDFINLNSYFPAPNLQFISTSYGAEFSSDSSKLYITSSKFYRNYTWEYNIHQFDLTNYSAPAILASGIEIAPVRPGGDAALQLAIDGKMYVAEFEQNYLSVINNPNLGGLASDYQANEIPLLSGVSELGLPPFIQSFFVVGLRARNFCLGEATEFEVTSSDSVLSINWDFGDGNTSTLENPSHTYSNTGDYTVSVTVTTASETKTETKEITIFETPVAIPLADLEGCITENTYDIDLPSFNSTVLGTQDPTVFTVDYFLSQAEADANTNPLEAIHSFDFGTTPVFVRVSNANNGQCFNTTQFNIIAREAPIVDTITDWTVCDDDTDGLYTFDLSLKNTEIFNGQDETRFEILYFASQADADAGATPLPIAYTNTAVTETIFVRFQNSTFPTCFRTGSFMIEVSTGVVANTPGNLEICDDDNDGFSTFNLTDAEPEIIGTQSASALSISYHTTLTDAEDGLNPLPSSYTTSVSGNQTIYVRVANASDTNCHATTSFELLVYDAPKLQTVTDWNVCDDDMDGIFDFDLTEKNNEILGSQDSANVSVRYYETLTDANLAQNEIVGTYTNIANPQTIFYRSENTLNSKCFVTDSFDIQVFETPFASNPTPLILCDVNDTGSQVIDLSQSDFEILGSQDPNEFTVAYYASQSDAENSINELSGTSYVNTQRQETVYARVERNTLETCYALTLLEITMNPLPQPTLEERYVICPDSPALVIDGGDFETWSWQDANGTELSTNRTFDVIDLGEYQLNVSQTTNGVRCENSVSFEVLSSGAPESLEVETNGFSDQIDVTVTATGTGPFEYSVDGENYQVSNEFKVFPGKYTVYVRDLEECRILSEELIAIGYQRFFTPNGDGSNEYWNIIGRELYQESQLFIFDRYGKFLAQISPNSNGWDGRLNGIPLRESDYWFKFIYDNNQVMTGHFTLKM